MNFKKIMAGALCATMVLGSTVAVFADNNGSATGNSQLEGLTEGAPFSVVLPTVGSNAYDMTLDPQNLLAQYDTDKSKYTSSSVYFHNTANSTDAYTGTSDVATAVSKCDVDVILTADVEVTNVATNPVTFTSASDVETNTELNVYVGLVPTTKGTVAEGSTATAGAVTSAQAVAVGTDGKATLSFYLEADANNFTVTQTTDASVASGHKYVNTAKGDATWKTAGFALSAACNTTADWSAYNEKSQLTSDEKENLAVKVTWSMEKASDAEIAVKDTADVTTGVVKLNIAPSIATTEYILAASTEQRIPVSLGCGTKAATKVSDIKYTINATTYSLPTSAWSYADSVVTISAARVDVLISGGNNMTYNIIFDDGTSIPVTLKMPSV